MAKLNINGTVKEVSAEADTPLLWVIREHADPAAELPMLAVLYGATIKALGPKGVREIGAEEFFVSALTNCLEPDEIVFEIDFPILKGHSCWAFEEIARRFGDFALASIALSFAMHGGEREIRFRRPRHSRQQCRPGSAQALCRHDAGRLAPADRHLPLWRDPLLPWRRGFAS